MTSNAVGKETIFWTLCRMFSVSFTRKIETHDCQAIIIQLESEIISRPDGRNP